MANPKYKMSKCKTRRRRANIHMIMPGISVCPNCKAAKMPHRVCFACGKYKDRDIISLEESAQA